MRRLLIAAVATAALSIPAEPARAQQAPLSLPQAYQQPSSAPLYDVYNRSNLSPYLNLLRGGSPSANYYLGVVPEFTARTFQNRTTNELNTLYNAATRPIETLEDPLWRQPLIRVAPPTGHPTGFVSYGPYFNMPRR
jgi:hypothetical protein